MLSADETGEGMDEKGLGKRTNMVSQDWGFTERKCGNLSGERAARIRSDVHH